MNSMKTGADKLDVLKLLWQGDISLAVTFWLYGTAGLFVLSIGQAAVKVTANLVILLVYVTLFVVYCLFVSVAIWRAAQKYKGSVWWARLAQFYTLAIIGGVIFGVFKGLVKALSVSP